jgi:hypothetical protein
MIEVHQPAAAVMTIQASFAEYQHMLIHKGGLGLAVAVDTYHLFGRIATAGVAGGTLHGNAGKVQRMLRQAVAGEPLVVKLIFVNLDDVSHGPFVIGVT